MYSSLCLCHYLFLCFCSRPIRRLEGGPYNPAPTLSFWVKPPRSLHESHGKSIVSDDVPHLQVPHPLVRITCQPATATLGPKAWHRYRCLLGRDTLPESAREDKPSETPCGPLYIYIYIYIYIFIYLLKLRVSNSGEFTTAQQAELQSPKRGFQIETEASSNRSKTKRLRNNQLGPAWASGPEDRSNIETKIPIHVEIESIEPRPTLQRGGRYC